MNLVYIPVSKLNLETQKILEDSYTESFPPSERRPWKKLLSPQKEGQKAWAVYHSNNLCAMLLFWHLENFVFLEYFFVLESYRGYGIGSEIITQFRQTLISGQNLLLEAEPAHFGELACRRLAFYERLGIIPLEIDYYQPSWDGSSNLVELRLLSTNPMSSLDAIACAKSIHRLVYNVDFNVVK